MSERDTGPLPSFQKTKPGATTFGAMVLKSFAVLGLLFLIFFGIYWIFGRLAFEDLPRTELYSQVMRGQAEVRRMAALEWATKLQNADSQKNLEKTRAYLPSEEETAVLAQELKSLEASAQPNVDLIAGILGVLGHSYSVRAHDALRDFLATSRDAEWSRAQVQAVVGLARRSPEDPATLDTFAKILAEGRADASLRKAIAYGLGFAGEGEPDTETWTRKSVVLESLLRDPAADVRWNAAFSALRLGVDLESAQAQLADLVAELHADLSRSPDKARETQLVLKRDTYLEALNLAQKVPMNAATYETLKKQVVEIADQHPDLKIRQGAKAALKSKD
ncbi:MAG TPA: hypothetical protein VM901_08230 [Bdellovibrionota bacterium]|jgi:hypothetical protein|nr:hypothetical protein [Bdellovibrionota bacterium]